PVPQEDLYPSRASSWHTGSRPQSSRAGRRSSGFPGYPSSARSDCPYLPGGKFEAPQKARRLLKVDAEQLHPLVSLLPTLKAQEQPLACVGRVSDVPFTVSHQQPTLIAIDQYPYDD